MQLRVLPGPLDTVDVTPSSAAAAATEPEGFHTFVRGGKRAGTHVLLQAKDACGNFLTRDAVDGLEVRCPCPSGCRRQPAAAACAVRSLFSHPRTRLWVQCRCHRYRSRS